MTNKLREFRFFKSMSQWQLRIPTGISQTKISLIERGYLEPSDVEKKKIAKAFNVKPCEIFPIDEPIGGSRS